MTAPVLRDWDSQFFGFQIASVEVPSLTPGTEQDLAAWARENRVACLYVLSDSERDAVDERMTFESKPGATMEPIDNVRLAIPSDVQVLEQLARSSHRDSRFYADQQFDRSRCDDLYATWIRRSCQGWADAVWVAVHNGAPAGYLTCHNRGSIGLVAVAEHARGCGLGRQLVAAGRNYFLEKNLACIEVVTQGRNRAARRLYESCGFRLSSVRFWRHLWFPENLDA